MFRFSGKSKKSGVELAGKFGAVTFGSEYYRSEWNRENDTDPDSRDGIAEFSWFPARETTQYREEKFIRQDIKAIAGFGNWPSASATWTGTTKM